MSICLSAFPCRRTAMITRASDIAEWIRQQVTIAGARGLVVGLTGGLESAVVARLCAAATPGRVICAFMP